MPKLTRADRFRKLVEAGWDRKAALRRVGYRPASPHSADSLATSLLQRKGRIIWPRKITRLSKAHQTQWQALLEGQRFPLDGMTTKEIEAELDYIANWSSPEAIAARKAEAARKAAEPKPVPKPSPPPPVPPEPEENPEFLKRLELAKELNRAAAWTRAIVHGGRGLDEPAPPHGENDGIWDSLHGFRSYDQIAQDEAAAEEAARPIFRQTDDLRFLTSRRR